MNGGLGLGLRLGMGGGGGGVPVTDIFNDSNIPRTFSQEVQPLTVTNTSPAADGTGSYEVFNNTLAAWVNGVLSTSDNVQWQFNPTSNFTVGDSVTLHLKDTILTVVGDNPYEGPFTVEYKVVNRLPTMDTFTVDATSDDANIGILTATGTDLDGHSLTFGISLTNNSSTVALYQNEAAWQGSGFDTGLPEGTDETVTLYCFAKDSLGGISLVSISDTCAVDIPDTTAPVMTAFSVEPTSVVANIEIFTLLATDAIGVASYQVNEVATIPDAGVGTWKSSAQWITDGYDSSVSEGSPETVTLYAWAKDAADNVSAAPTLSDSCDVTITHAPTFSVQPTLATALYDGGLFDFTVDDVNPAHTVDVQSWNGTAWATVLTNVAIGAKTDIEVSGLAAGSISGIKFRVSDTGETDYTESDDVTTFNTVAPTLTSVTPGDTTNTLVFADNANDTSDTFTIKWGFASGVLTETPITSATSPYEHSSLTNDTEYFYEVVAVKGGLESTASSEDSGTPTEDTTFWSDTFATSLDLNTWSVVEDTPGRVSVAGGQLIMDTFDNNAETAVVNAKRAIRTDVDGRLMTQFIPSEQLQTASPPGGIILQNSATSEPAYSVPDIIAWFIVQNNGAGGAIEKFRFRYWDNLGASKYWDEAGSQWSASSASNFPIPVDERDDVWEHGIEIDDGNSQWRGKYRNVTTATDSYTDWVAFAATRAFGDTLYSSIFFDAGGATRIYTAVNEVRYEAL